MKKLATTIILLLMVLITRAQNDAQFSQYMFNGIYINPAYAGYKEELNLHSFYRSQWTGIKGAPTSMSLALDAIANDKKVGLALQVSKDKFGAQSALSAYANYAYRLRVGENEDSRLAFGLGVGVVQLGLDGSQLDPDEQYDNYIPGNMLSTILPDAKIGTFYSNNRWYAGLSVDNLIARFFDKKNEQNYLIPAPMPHLYLTAGVLVPLSEGIQLKPSFLIKDYKGGPTSLDINSFILFGEKLWVGASYRTAVNLYNKSYLQSGLNKDNSVVGIVELFAGDSIRIGYAFDYSLGRLLSYSGGSHELSVAFYLKRKGVKMFSPRYF